MSQTPLNNTLAFDGQAGAALRARATRDPQGAVKDAADAAGYPVYLRMQPGYDHSYYFIASFIGEHIAHHATALKA